MAAVFGQLWVGDVHEGVHVVLVPIRDEQGNALPGVTLGDHGHKGGLLGVDNGTIAFEHVRVPVRCCSTGTAASMWTGSTSRRSSRRTRGSSRCSARWCAAGSASEAVPPRPPGRR
ncbi:hypothetical protein [Tessaracoccus coleopterorum]|uniref:hypothetical protein n=1 Tax=Tessaracoccus coleopterorum TaxID=2714950 RepID=UPI0018D38F37|nr:hypothetical protein [Tessaracoccus coleopterorum]